jgi:hypothetical protein
VPPVAVAEAAVDAMAAFDEMAVLFVEIPLVLLVSFEIRGKRVLAVAFCMYRTLVK